MVVLSKNSNSPQNTSILNVYFCHLQEENQRRLEKAEILEHTVLFLQKITKEGAAKRGAEEKQSFQGGFSTCLQRAAQFLGPQGKELWLGVALQDSSSSAHVASSHSPCSQTSPLLLRNSSKPVVRLLVNKSGHTLQFVPASTPSSCVQSRRELSFSPPSTPQQSQKAVSRSSTHLPQPTSHSLWRPWPWPPGHKWLWNATEPAFLYSCVFSYGTVQCCIYCKLIKNLPAASILPAHESPRVECRWLMYFCTLIYSICHFLNKKWKLLKAWVYWFLVSTRPGV